MCLSSLTLVNLAFHSLFFSLSLVCFKLLRNVLLWVKDVNIGGIKVPMDTIFDHLYCANMTCDAMDGLFMGIISLSLFIFASSRHW